MGFNSSLDIANRACQHCGVPRIDATLGFTEISQQSGEINFVYGKLKRAELRRNVWRFATRRAALRAIDTNTLVVSPALWLIGTTYFQGSIVADSTGFVWISKIANNVGFTPGTSYNWEPYFGPMTVSQYDSTLGYFAGELVYTAPGDGTNNVYLSLVSGNELDPSLPNQWSSATVYSQNQVVQQFPAWAVGTTYAQGGTVTYTDGNTYASVTAGNVGNVPSTSGANWALVPVLILASQAVPAVTTNTPPTTSPIIEWASTTVYSSGAFVMFDAVAYLSIINNNTGNTPNAAGSTSWVALTGGVLYMSLINLNINNSPANAPALWSSGTTYAINNLVGGSDGNIYKSVGNGNINHNPVGDLGVHWTNTGVLNPWTTVFTQGGGNQQWLQIGGAAFPNGVALTKLDIVYPLGSGPCSDTQTANVFRLPAGYLRVAPQDPKAGTTSWLGVPGNITANDWTYEGNYIVSWQSGVIVYRFVADVVDVTTFDDMFCEGLAARIGLEVCETLTQSTSKIQTIASQYKQFMSEARTINGIEVGPVYPPLEDLIACRF